jgi:2-hydroxyacylsphingosine 1-beta-galactosyltransferase
MPPSFVPSSITPFSDRMAFHERLLNTLFRWVHALSYDHIVGKEAEKIYRKYLGQDVPSLGEIEAKASLILSNSHPALTHPRPLTPDLIEVGCIHCREARKLDKKFSNFLESSVRGVIYFSLGSMFKLTPEMFQTLLQAFSSLPQDVIINTDFEVPPCNLSDNVMLTKWAPQQDILGHCKLKLFITHGGIQSFFEGVFHAVPLIVLPIWADQALVGGSVEKLGNGLVLEILDLTEDKIVSAVTTVLKDKR